MFRILLVIAVFLTNIPGLGTSIGQAEVIKNEFEKGVVNFNSNLIFPIINGQAYKIEQFKAEIFLDQTKTHPLTAAGAVLNLVRDAYLSQDPEELMLARKYLDWLADSYLAVLETEETKVWQYNFPHGNFPSGWWSGMANAVISLAFRAGYEVFGDQRYNINYEKAMNGVLFSVDKGGSSLKLDPDSIWICEYADSKVNKKMLSRCLMVHL